MNKRIYNNRLIYNASLRDSEPEQETAIQSLVGGVVISVLVASLLAVRVLLK